MLDDKMIAFYDLQFTMVAHGHELMVISANVGKTNARNHHTPPVWELLIAPHSTYGHLGDGLWHCFTRRMIEKPKIRWMIFGTPHTPQI